MTRKRQKFHEIQEKLNLEPSALSVHGFQFHPILESIAQFFNLTDCAKVAKLSHDYHNKTWLYVLHSSNRVELLNNVIQLNIKSLTWITKYRMHLKYQKIQVSSRIKFDLSSIPQCLSLGVFQNVSKFPLQVKHVIFCRYNAKFPNIKNVQTVAVTHFDLHSNVLQTCPKTITKLKIQSFNGFDCQYLPILPVLNKFYCNAYYVRHAKNIQEKLPNVTTLHFKVEQLNDLEDLDFFKHRLIINCHRLITTGIFHKFKCQELDLSQCSNIRDYSGVAHIPIVKRYENK
jgi:hypothetical protein